MSRLRTISVTDRTMEMIAEMRSSIEMSTGKDPGVSAMIRMAIADKYSRMTEDKKESAAK